MNSCIKWPKSPHELDSRPCVTEILSRHQAEEKGWRVVQCVPCGFPSRVQILSNLSFMIQQCWCQFTKMKSERRVCVGRGKGECTGGWGTFPSESGWGGQHGAYRMGKGQLFTIMGTACRCSNMLQATSKPPSARNCDPHFRDEKMEVQRSIVTCSRSYNSNMIAKTCTRSIPLYRPLIS